MTIDPKDTTLEEENLGIDLIQFEEILTGLYAMNDVFLFMILT